MGKCTKKSQCHKVGVCDDKKAKTTDDKCDAKAVCRGVDKCSGKSCPAKSPCHAPGSCDFKTGLCSNPFAPKTLKCDDKNPKTGDDKCNGAGICKGRNLCANKKIKCAAKDSCHVAGTCFSGTGRCTNPVKKAGT